MLLAVNLFRDFFGLFTIATWDRQFVLALLAVPDGVLPANTHGDANLPGVLWNLVTRHDWGSFAKSVG
jgi:hypothetical protein